ncbi:MAG: hypothetical protein KAU20_02290 [Nanoarchaeota archaeon]|nr:hypothetical protein [Nanoarchaeota archaeon]
MPNNKFKTGDMVFVKEYKLDGSPLEMEWHGRIVAQIKKGDYADGENVCVKDTNRIGSYFGSTFPRHTDNLSHMECRFCHYVDHDRKSSLFACGGCIIEKDGKRIPSFRKFKKLKK